MKSSIRLLFSSHYWKRQFSFAAFLKSAFSVLGVIAAGIAAIKKVSELLNPESTEIKKMIENHYGCLVLMMVVVAAIMAFYLLKPVTRVSARVKKRDLTIAIELGDIFDTTDTLVIGTNCTFDTDPAGGLISPSSLQAQYTERYFGNFQNLDAVLVTKLEDESFVELVPEVKRIGKRRQYPMGTVVKLNSKSRDAYFVTNARMNGHGVASSTITDLQESLAGLWEFISERGGGLPNLRMPVIGTGLAKVTATREEVVREILRSFFASCSADRFCDQLTIVISVNDYITHEIDLRALGEYLNYLATYTEFKGATDTGLGVGIAT
jgi:hypothetical protein